MSRPPSLPGPGRRRRWAAAGLAAALLATAGGVWAWRGRPAPPALPEVPTDGVAPGVLAEVEDARERVRAAPRDADAWGRLGTVLYSARFMPQAVESFESARRLDPADARWPYLIGAVNLLYDDPGRAVPYFRLAADAARFPSDRHRAAARLRLAEALLTDGDAAGAERLFRDRLAEAPGDARAELGLAQVLLGRDDFTGAADHFRAATADPVAAKKAHPQLAFLARLRGDAEGAAAHARAAAAGPEKGVWPDPFLDGLAGPRGGGLTRVGRQTSTLAPRAEAGDYVNRGKALARAGDRPGAVAEFRAALGLDPDNVQARFNLGYSLVVLADARDPGDRPPLLREALPHLDRALALKPDLAPAYLVKGQVLAALGDLPGAVDALRRGVEARPDSGPVQLALAVFLAKAGRPTEARARLPDLDRVVPPDDPQLADLKRQLGPPP